jgi:hypothetical protein
MIADSLYRERFDTVVAHIAAFGGELKLDDGFSVKLEGDAIDPKTHIHTHEYVKYGNTTLSRNDYDTRFEPCETLVKSLAEKQNPKIARCVAIWSNGGATADRDVFIEKARVCGCDELFIAMIK